MRKSHLLRKACVSQLACSCVFDRGIAFAASNVCRIARFIVRLVAFVCHGESVWWHTISIAFVAFLGLCIRAFVSTAELRVYTQLHRGLC